jgi:hypothetical protein
MNPILRIISSSNKDIFRFGRNIATAYGISHGGKAIQPTGKNSPRLDYNPPNSHLTTLFSAPLPAPPCLTSPDGCVKFDETDLL